MNSRRLLLLADHLDKGKLSVDEFDMATWHEKRDCATSGCAAGECVALWPDDWMWVERNGVLVEPILRHVPTGTAWRSLMTWFELSFPDASLLFELPPTLENNRRSVARRIREFVEKNSQPKEKAKP